MSSSAEPVISATDAGRTCPNFGEVHTGRDWRNCHARCAECFAQTVPA